MSRLRQYVNKMMGSCENCKHDSKTHLEWPCVNCVNNVKDHFEEKTNGWIPCSERLPECEWGAETEALMFQIGDRIYTGHFGAGGNSRDYYFRIYADPLDGWDASDVIAWMPLPPAYQPKERSE